MKNGIISLLISLSGIVLVLILNNQTHESYISELLRLNPSGLSDGFEVPNIKKQIGYGTVLGLVALYFAFKQFKRKKWIGIVVGSLAILLIYIDFIPFWKFHFGDSMLDINIK